MYLPAPVAARYAIAHQYLGLVNLDEKAVFTADSVWAIHQLL